MYISHISFNWYCNACLIRQYNDNIGICLYPFNKNTNRNTHGEMLRFTA